jgi:hypothetical protein
MTGTSCAGISCAIRHLMNNTDVFAQELVDPKNPLLEQENL